jgi:hypothetical protein
VIIPDIETITKGIGVVTATLALIGGGYTLYDKFGFEDPILTWAPEYFKITDGPADGEFKVTAAREKHRDDCTVEDFVLDVRDSELIVHPVSPSITKFMGPATDKVDTFAYKISIDKDHQHKVAKGLATLVAYIHYECPEGKVIVNYPDHDNLRFNITE